jgi:hypothetical protein
MDPSPLPRLPIIFSLHQYARFHHQSVGQLADSREPGGTLTEFQFVYGVVGCASLLRSLQAAAWRP